jgi:hypothetical protein
MLDAQRLDSPGSQETTSEESSDVEFADSAHPEIPDSPGTLEAEESSDVEFADSAYPDSKLVPDMLSM